MPQRFMICTVFGSMPVSSVRYRAQRHLEDVQLVFGYVHQLIKIEAAGMTDDDPVLPGTEQQPLIAEQSDGAHALTIHFQQGFFLIAFKPEHAAGCVIGVRLRTSAGQKKCGTQKDQTDRPEGRHQIQDSIR
jgi:hypothetical protein